MLKSVNQHAYFFTVTIIVNILALTQTCKRVLYFDLCGCGVGAPPRASFYSSFISVDRIRLRLPLSDGICLQR